MRISNRGLLWVLVLGGFVLLPAGMTIAVVAAFSRPGELPDDPAPFVLDDPAPTPASAQAPTGPKVVAAWAAGPMEARVAFDRPVDAAVASTSVGRAIAFGPAVDAPDEGRPGGDGGSIRVAAARLVDDGRTLILTTDPHPRAATYTLTVDGFKEPGAAGPGHPAPVTYSLAGVAATWTPEGADAPSWSGWWPALNPGLAHHELGESAGHAALWPMLKRPGKLAVRSLVRLPAGPAEVLIEANGPFEVTLGNEEARADAKHAATVKLEATGDPVDLAVTLATPVAADAEPFLRLAAVPPGTPADAARALARHAFAADWAPPTPPKVPAAPLPPGLESGGDPARGAAVFASEQAKCANCHRVRGGAGGVVGPDLGHLAGAGRAWVYQNIVEPSATIHPDYLSYTVAFKDGRIAMGVVRAEGADALRVGDTEGRFATSPRAEVEELRPSTSSIMPVGLLGVLGDDKTRDLLAFLTAPAPASPPPGR